MVREVQHIGPDGQPIVDYNPYGEFPSQSAMGTYGRNGRATNYEHIAAAASATAAAAAAAAAEGSDYRTHSPSSEVGSRRYAEPAYGRNAYADYETYPQLGTTAIPASEWGDITFHFAAVVVFKGAPRAGPPPDYAYQTAQPPGLYRDYPEMVMDANAGIPAGAVPLYGDRPPTPPSPSEQSESPLPHHARGNNLINYA